MPEEERKVLNASDAAPPRSECFVVMPISDPEGYSAGHFQRVYADIFAPACEEAGYKPVRADDIRETNLIHLDVLQRLLNSPMVLVDLSSRNPNVLFELGLRQAFDKPVVLVQEAGTPKIFDIAPLRFTEYRKARIYNEVLEDQREIAAAIKATRDTTGINSMVRILSLTQPASLPEVQDANRDPVLQLIRAELSELRIEIRRSQRDAYFRGTLHEDEAIRREMESLAAMTQELEARFLAVKHMKGMDKDLRRDIRALLDRTELIVRSTPRHPDTIFPNFIQNAYRKLLELESGYSALQASKSTSNSEGVVP
jgi:hypothetical protein